MANTINPSDYNLHDSETNEILDKEELHCTHAEFAAAIRDSLDCDQPEGHVLCRGRRVYAMPA